MKRLLIFTLLYLFFIATALSAQPIRLHPDNPHYFQYHGKPMVLVTSAEHYGAVINRAFDYETYLSTLKKIGLNHTRIFLGDYYELPGSFCIATNTLAPTGENALAPWARSSEPGFRLGGNKFDLDRWDPDYFKRLRAFMSLAQEKGIVVEAVLFFTCMVDDTSPLYGENNINDMPNFTPVEYRTLGHPKILARQKVYCEKLVAALNPYDNLIINIVNEPWFSNQAHGGFSSPPPAATNAWIHQVSQWIVDQESDLPKQHLISTDYTNQGEVVPQNELDGYFEHISVFNHHYDQYAESVRLNYHIPRAWSFNETGLMPTATPEYRIQGWKYLMYGGALYNVLDFTWEVGFEDGHGTTHFDCGYSSYQGCTDHDVKYQMASLLTFWNDLDFINMQPDEQCLSLVFGHMDTWAFSKPGQTYVVYFVGAGEPRVYLDIPSGQYHVEWLEPRTLQLITESDVMVENNFINLAGPGFGEDIVVKLEKMD